MSDLDPKPPAEAGGSLAVAATLEITTAFTTSGKLVRSGLGDCDRPLGRGDLIAGRYEIQRPLGQGGCGQVYAVFDRELEVDVALKTLRPDLSLSAEAVAQLKREIQLARRVTHANVCRIFDVGFHDAGRAFPFLTMEMIDGPSLADRLLQEGRLDLEEIAALTRQLIAGLEAAHRAGVIHADLKPANIMLTADGGEPRAVITDFGLATAQAIDLAPEGYIVGTPAYMAPEQVEGKALSPATDYYALGCTLYHAATGDVPFREKGPYATAMARLERDPEPPGERVEMPAAWSEIITGLLGREPATRLDGDQLLKLLDPPRRRRSWLWALVALAGVSVLAAALLWGGRAEPREPLELSMPADPIAAAKLLEAESRLAAGAPTAALALLDEARELSPESPRVHATIAAANRLIHPRRAVQDQRRAAELADDLDPDERTYYQALLQRAENRFGEATATLTELDLRRPNSFAIEFHLAELQSLSGYADLARRTLSRIEPPDAEAAVRVLWARIEIETITRDFSRALELARQMRDQARQSGSVSGEARAEARIARCLRQLGDIDGSAASAARALALAQRVDEPYLIAVARYSLVSVFMSRHRFSEALVHLEGREAALERLGLDSEAVRLEITRAEVFIETGRLDRALALLDGEVIPDLRRRGEVYWEGYSLLVRSELRRTRGEPARALDDCRAGHAIFRSLGNRRLAAFAQTICASVQVATGEIDEAAAAIDQAAAIRTALELEPLVAQNRIDRGEIALARDDPEAAAAEAEAAARFFDEQPVVNDQATALELLARARWRAGDRSGARAAIAAARERVEGESVRLEHVVAMTERVLDGDARASAGLARQITELEKIGYWTLALEARIARAVVERQLGHPDRAEALETAARAEARRRGLRPYRYRIPE